MEIPRFKNECYILFVLDSKTGKVLNNDGTYYESQGDDYYLIKENWEDVESFVRENLTEEIDISVYTNNNEYLKYFSLLNKD